MTGTMNTTDNQSEQLSTQSTTTNPNKAGKIRVALLGNPNTGKTTLFNRLCGMRAKTANFPGITVEARVGPWAVSSESFTEIDLIDLPGLYRLALNTPEAALCRNVIAGNLDSDATHPDALLIILDATNLERNLAIAVEAIKSGKPTVVALNMIDIASKRKMIIDTQLLSQTLACPVVEISAKSGNGIKLIPAALDEAISSHVPDSVIARLPDLTDQTALDTWCNATAILIYGSKNWSDSSHDKMTDRLDHIFTHPILGLVAFCLVMAGLFMVVFSVANYPMDIIDGFFGTATEFVAGLLPEGFIRDLLTDGIIAGVGGVVIFLPQICLLFFLISLLEDTGYLARAALVVDRLFAKFGLSGHSFIPFLSSHACAIPGIMSAKLIPDRRNRITTIFVAPFMSCAARVPVYVLLTGILFASRPAVAGLVFFGCYVLGGVAALLTALLIRRTLLAGPSQPMVLELPTYKIPSLRTAILMTWDRAFAFLKNAGTVILGISIVLWWLGSFPAVSAPDEAVALRNQVEQTVDMPIETQEAMLADADALETMNAQANSYIGRIGKSVQPVFAPLGYDWKLTVAVLTSFAAREVFASTMAVLTSGSDDTEDEGVLQGINNASRDDGSPMFDTPTALSLLVFYVLAMQCLPTLAVTRRETGGWKWAGFQLGYMSVLAYVAAFVTYQGAIMFGL